MRLMLGPVLSLVLLIASLGVLANAYVGHDEFIARSAVDGLSMRGESLAVPFQHFLREFLEGAADVYKRSLDEYEDGILEARVRNVAVMIRVMETAVMPRSRMVQSNTLIRDLITPDVIRRFFRGDVTWWLNNGPDRVRELRMNESIDQNQLEGGVLTLSVWPAHGLQSPPPSPPPSP
ncbi:hypothetical protein DFP72DRAFT_1174047 [Ephemerocybe angulata]|uniref:Uncharacterized protein n=1 Tax=Ephemerocybe angulata TaxID=980116 RepID=A0A8H6M1J0_9AGAR|nr:hypothetical protein DFP72DRAFT_1174047 [Tulosesus angulatus]